MTMIREVLYTTGITATAGIGTNLYLAKLAMDITAKHAAPDKDKEFGVDAELLIDHDWGLEPCGMKNAVLKGTNYLDGATMRERNKTISGHKAD